MTEKVIDHFFACLPRKIPKNVNAKKVCLVAHRGAHDKKLGIIENTDAAFARALALGCFGIELDLHATADGVLVVNHDASLSRLWGRDLAIGDLNFQTLRKLVPEIPSLAEVVKRYGKKLHLFIELKAPFKAEKALKEELKPLTAVEDYHLISLNAALFASLRCFPPEAMLLTAVHNNVGQFFRQTLEKNYGGLLGHYLLINNRKIKKLKSAQKKVGVGMVDSKSTLYRELNRGACWIFSNKAGLISDYLRALGTLATTGL
jgi:glycerophosphoryl diester phosphodiesterase